ncbi:hypothetical protein SDC9_115741 [bioreactor metagenome]|uniref:Uncharacterized protein n=1 Tax=bioreactor metagenome TaxID=1076179 RepID=A0A645BUC8_9ZZZZ
MEERRRDHRNIDPGILIAPEVFDHAFRRIVGNLHRHRHSSGSVFDRQFGQPQPFGIGQERSLPGSPGDEYAPDAEPELVLDQFLQRILIHLGPGGQRSRHRRPYALKTFPIQFHRRNPFLFRYM